MATPFQETQKLITWIYSCKPETLAKTGPVKKLSFPILVTDSLGPELIPVYRQSARR